jgi:pyruvate kinase
MKKITIITTIGPSSLDKNKVKKMDQSGADIFRINLSHTEIDNYENVITKLSKWTNKTIALDSEGAQLRTRNIKGGTTVLKANEKIYLVNDKNYKGEKSQIPINIDCINKYLFAGDLLNIDFDSALIQISESHNDYAVARVISKGIIGSNKGINVDNNLSLPPFTNKDLKAFEIAHRLKQNMIFISFCSSSEQIRYLREIFTYNINIIAKIESEQGLNNLDTICSEADAILIDRGDLSRDVPLEKIPYAQELIIDISKKHTTPIYVATNLMENMISNSKPTRAEVHDIVKSLESGADGLVLAAETAIGLYPVECVRVLSRIINQYFNYSNFRETQDTQSQKINELTTFLSDSIIKPHGDYLIQQKIEELDSNIKNESQILDVDKEVYLDVTQICEGTFSPVDSFMNKSELRYVLEKNKYKNDILWTLPILLQVDAKTAKTITNNETVVLRHNKNNLLFATLKINSIEKISNMELLAKKWFGTDDLKHPGVSQFYNKGNYIISGKPLLIKNSCPGEKHNYSLTPKQSRRIFYENDWLNIVGFHTRNAPHMGHEYIQLKAIERANADAIFIAPVIGKKKQGDFKHEVIIECYERLIHNAVYGETRVILGGLDTYSRFSGPREAVFTAICHKNFGCNHFIVGRDHTGVGEYYTANASKEMINSVDLGMNLIMFDEIRFDEKEKIYFENTHSSNIKFSSKLSGTVVRNNIINSESLPKHLLKPYIADLLANGKKDDIFE